MTVIPEHKPNRLPLEEADTVYVISDFNRSVMKNLCGTMAEGISALNWFIELGKFDYRVELYFFSGTLEKHLGHFVSLLSGDRGFLTVDEAIEIERGIDNFGFVLTAAITFTKLWGKKAKPLRSMFKALQRLEERIFKIAAYLPEAQAKAPSIAKLAKPKTKKQQPAEPLPLAA
jgi:hypothetical protein